MPIELEIIRDTVLKPSTTQSSQLKADEMVRVKTGDLLPVLGYLMEPDRIHAKITLDPGEIDLKALHPSAKNTWWLWREAINDPAGYSFTNRPVDNPPEQRSGFNLQLPGRPSVISSASPIDGSPNFTWAEALHVDANGNYRKPASSAVVNNIIAIAQVMQQVRALLNQPIVINSWYRDPDTNRRIGGASQSRHMVGDAVDFNVPGADLKRIYSLLDPWWSVRGGLARGNGFIHIDKRGYRARWDYPGVR